MMKIFITAPGEFTGAMLKTGCYYFAEPAEEGTNSQNRLFHALVQEYWASGCHSYRARNFEHFRALVKLYLGAGMEKFTNLINADGTPCPEGRMDYRLKSWTDYSKKERQMTIDNLMGEMLQAGVNSLHFEEILQGMERSA